MIREHGFEPPKRWKDTGVPLDDGAALGGYDLPRLRAAVDARVAAGSGSVSGQGLAVAVAGGVALVLAAAIGWGVAPSSAPGPAAVAPVAVAPLAAPVVAPADLDPARAPEVIPAAPPVAVVAGGSPDPAARGVETAAVVAHVADVAPAEGAEAAPAPVEAVAVGTADPVEGDLAAQTAQFRAGQAALAEGRLADAAALHGAYLQRWPAGAYRDDALVSILDLAIRNGAWAHVEPLAAELSAVPSLAPRHAELRRVRAEALVHLGRCDEAVVVAETVSRDAVAAVRRTCRGLPR